jgi:hypothetical protein
VTDLDPLLPAATVGVLRLMNTYGLRRKYTGELQMSEAGKADRVMAIGVRKQVDRLIQDGLMEELEDGTVRLSDDGHQAIWYFYENRDWVFENRAAEVYIPAP